METKQSITGLLVSSYADNIWVNWTFFECKKFEKEDVYAVAVDVLCMSYIYLYIYIHIV